MPNHPDVGASGDLELQRAPSFFHSRSHSRHFPLRLNPLFLSPNKYSHPVKSPMALKGRGFSRAVIVFPSHQNHG